MVQPEPSFVYRIGPSKTVCIFLPSESDSVADFTCAGSLRSDTVVALLENALPAIVPEDSDVEVTVLTPFTAAIILSP